MTEQDLALLGSTPTAFVSGSYSVPLRNFYPSKKEHSPGPYFKTPSEQYGRYYSTLNSRILIIRTPNKVHLIFGNRHIPYSLWLKTGAPTFENSPPRAPGPGGLPRIRRRPVELGNLM